MEILAGVPNASEVFKRVQVLQDTVQQVGPQLLKPNHHAYSILEHVASVGWSRKTLSMMDDGTTRTLQQLLFFSPPAKVLGPRSNVLPTFFDEIDDIVHCAHSINSLSPSISIPSTRTKSRAGHHGHSSSHHMTSQQDIRERNHKRQIQS